MAVIKGNPMEKYFKDAKENIIKALSERALEITLAYEKAAPGMAKDAVERLLEYTKRGKMLRACLVRLGFELANAISANSPKQPTKEQLNAITYTGAALELFQSGLLAHDDIMDRDRLRRGKASLHVSYEEELRQGGYSEPEHYGEALAICLGDLAFFCAFDFLTETGLAADIQNRLVAKAAKELSLVGLAQMRDVANGALRPKAKASFDCNSSLTEVACSSEPGEDAIMALYRYKTARYTFSLPLAMGAIVARAKTEECKLLESIGEKLGIIFQIKDDELGIFADEKVLGKPSGTDIIENKRTLYRFFLFKKADPDLLLELNTIFGKKNLSEAKLKLVRDNIEKLGVRSLLADRMNGLAEEALFQAQDILKKAPLPASNAFIGLLDYSLSRKA